MDKILCSVDSYEFIANWLYKNNVKINELPVVLREFTMECEFAGLYGNSTWATFDMKFTDDGVVHLSNFKCKESSTKLPDCSFHKIDSITDNGIVGFSWGISCDRPLSDIEEKLGFCMIYYVTYVTYFMANFEPELVEYVEKEVKKKKKKGKSKSQSKLIQTQIIRLNKFVSDVKTGKKQVKRHYNKCTYSFGVKGHYRTYKSGKRVWIKPFQKNTLENRLKRSKEYTFNLKKK